MTLLDKAYNLAATHLMSDLPDDAKASDIIAALKAPNLPRGYELCPKINTDKLDLLYMIETLAADFISFSSN